jgi:luciferase family oxidoreductase group 1
VGRTAGTDDPATVAALLHGHPPTPLERFPEDVADLVGFLRGELAEDHPFASVRAMPDGPGAPQVWLLGSSSTSAGYAAQLGLPFSFAHFITPFAGPQVVAAYRRDFRPSPGLAEPLATVAVSVLCADTDAEAQRLAASFHLSRVRPGGSDAAPIPSVEEAEAYPYTPLERALLAQSRRRLVAGAPERVQAQLAALAGRFGVEELVVVTVCHEAMARLRSYELLAEVFLSERTGPVVSGALSSPHAQ